MDAVVGGGYLCCLIDEFLAAGAGDVAGEGHVVFLSEWCVWKNPRMRIMVSEVTEVVVESKWWDSNFFSALVGGVVAALIALAIFSLERRSARKASAEAARLSAVQGLLRPLATLSTFQMDAEPANDVLRELRVAIVTLQLTIPYKQRIVRNWLDLERQYGMNEADAQFENVELVGRLALSQQTKDSAKELVTKPFLDWAIQFSRILGEWQLGRVPDKYIAARVRMLKEDLLPPEFVERVQLFGEGDYASIFPDLSKSELKRLKYEK